MPSYDMNKNGDTVFYLKILQKDKLFENKKYTTFRLMEYALKNNLDEIINILGDTDIYFDLNGDGELSGIELVTFYDQDD